MIDPAAATTLPDPTSAPSAPAPATSFLRERGRILLALSVVYALMVLGVLIVIRWVGSAIAITSFLIMSPRILFLLPVAVLAICSGFRRCRRHWPIQGATALMVVGPLMGLNLPVHSLWTSTPEGETVRAVTYNLGTEGIDRERWLDWLAASKVDVVFLQEQKQSMKWLPDALKSRGFQVNRTATIASRFKLVELPPLKDRNASHERYTARLHRVRLETPNGKRIVVASIHLPTLRAGFERLIGDRTVETLILHNDWWRGEFTRAMSLVAETVDEPMLIGGDFNLPSDDTHLAALQSSYRFAFDQAGWGYGYSRPSTIPWVRIDHILSTPEWHVSRCFAGPDFGSDHLPVLAEFVLPATVPAVSGAPVAITRPAK